MWSHGDHAYVLNNEHSFQNSSNLPIAYKFLSTLRKKKRFSRPPPKRQVFCSFSSLRTCLFHESLLQFFHLCPSSLTFTQMKFSSALSILLFPSSYIYLPSITLFSLLTSTPISRLLSSILLNHTHSTPLLCPPLHSAGRSW